MIHLKKVSRPNQYFVKITRHNFLVYDFTIFDHIWRDFDFVFSFFNYIFFVLLKEIFGMLQETYIFLSIFHCLFPNNIAQNQFSFVLLRRKGWRKICNEEEQRILFSLNSVKLAHELTDVSPVLRVSQHGHTYEETVPERST